MKTVVGLFDNITEAREIEAALMKKGFRRDQIRIVDQRAETEYTKTKKGGFWESLFGDLSGTQEDRSYYSQGVGRGGALVMVTADDDKADIARVLMEYRGGEIQKGTTAAPAATAGTAKATEKVIPVIEEKVKIGKQQIAGTGGVRIFSRVTEKPVEETIRLRDERVNVERRPVDRPLTAADASAFKNETIELTEMKERAIVEKEARVVGEVVVNKEVAERTEKVRDKVRRMDVDVEKIPAGKITRYDSTFENDFRSHCSTTLAGKGLTYEQCQPAYQCGYELGSDARYGNADWTIVEPEARRRWTTLGHEASTWERFKDSIRYAWEKARLKLRAA